MLIEMSPEEVLVISAAYIAIISSVLKRKRKRRWYEQGMNFGLYLFSRQFPSMDHFSLFYFDSHGVKYPTTSHEFRKAL